MAHSYTFLAIPVGFSLFFASYAALNISSASPPTTKPIIDPKRRNDLVDEAFLEQKDVLLDMLEAKLKEVHDKKKKKGDGVNSNYSTSTDPNKCEPLPKNVDLKLNAHGISAIGEADVRLKFGNSGNGTLNLDATGISNIGQTRVQLGVGEGTVYVPGLNNIFAGPSFLKKPCEPLNPSNNASSATNANSSVVEIKEIDSRRLSENVNETFYPKQDIAFKNKSIVKKSINDSISNTDNGATPSASNAYPATFSNTTVP